METNLIDDDDSIESSSVDSKIIENTPIGYTADHNCRRGVIPIGAKRRYTTSGRRPSRKGHCKKRRKAIEESNTALRGGGSPGDKIFTPVDEPQASPPVSTQPHNRTDPNPRSDSLEYLEVDEPASTLQNPIVEGDDLLSQSANTLVNLSIEATTHSSGDESYASNDAIDDLRSHPNSISATVLPRVQFVIQGSMNQGDASFSPQSRGKQCTAIAQASLAFATQQDPQNWSPSDVDEVLLIGDALYSESIRCRLRFPENERNPEFLTAEEVKNEICLKGFKLTARAGAIMFGNVIKRVADFPNLASVLSFLTINNSRGLLTCRDTTIGLFAQENVLWIFDSHSRGPSGERVPSGEGVACLIGSTDIPAMQNLIISNLCWTHEIASRSQFQFTEIHFETEAVVEGPLLNHSLSDPVPSSTPFITDAQLQSTTNVCSNGHNDSDVPPNGDDPSRGTGPSNVSGGLNEGPRNIEDGSENAICNMDWVFECLHEQFDDHDPSSTCAFKNLKLVSTVSQGLNKIFKFKCERCGLEKNIKGTRNTPTSMDLNTAAILSAQTIGIGEYQMQEYLGGLNVRSMSPRTYQKHHAKVSKSAIAANEREMRKWREIEKELARERGDFIETESGVILYKIPIEGDGSYMKRSYVHSQYNSPAACIVIVGRHTGKVIDIQVIQKTCVRCARRIPHTPDECYSNHGVNESSTSMESRGFTMIFDRSVSVHQIIYHIVVTDGDSSIIAAIRALNPYGLYGIEVKHILCANHIHRNVMSGVKVVSQMKGWLGAIRKKIEESTKPLSDTMKKSIKNINLLDCDSSMKSRKLRSDLAIMLYHIYGDHSRCQENHFGCNGQMTQGEENLVPELMERHLFGPLEAAMQRAVNNVASLLLNWTTNISESVNARIVKGNAAKRLMLAWKDSYESRVNLGVLSFNCSETFGPVFREMGRDVPQIGEKVQQDRALKNQQRRERVAQRLEEGHVRVPTRTSGADKDYGKVEQPDISEEEMALRKIDHYKQLGLWQADAPGIELETRDQSFSPSWRTYRKWLITASIAGRIYRKSANQASASIVTDIVHRRPIKNRPALDWGIAYELVVKDQLLDMGWNLRPCGLSLHKHFKGIAATADGFIGNDGVLEIKSPYKARYTCPDKAITDKQFSISYQFEKIGGVLRLRKNQDIHCQMQMQMAATDRTWGLLAIGTTRGVFTMRVMRDEEFIHEMLRKCVKFYDEYVAPEILDSRQLRKKPLREPLHVLEAQEKRREKKAEKERLNQSRSSVTASKRKAANQTSKRGAKRQKTVQQTVQENVQETAGNDRN